VLGHGTDVCRGSPPSAPQDSKIMNYIEFFLRCGICTRILPNQNESGNLRFLALRIESAIRILKVWIRITDSGVQTLRICRDSDLPICNFNDLFCAIVLRIRKDSLNL
jgi:hypothetical protein